MDEKGKALLGRMMALCSKREYCEADIRKKLSASAGKPEDMPDPETWPVTCDEIVMALKNGGFIDDSRYARAFARDKSSISGWGKVKIKHGLIAKGIGRAVADEALSEIEGNPGLDRLARALEARYDRLKDDPYAKFRLLRYALGRGYEYDEIKGIVDDIVKR